MNSFVEKLGYLLILAAAILLKPLAVQANGYQSVASIMLQAEDFVMQYAYDSPYPPRFKAGKLDSRLKLKACHKPLVIEFSRPDYTYGKTTLTVSCKVNAAWKILLPARIELFEDVAIVTKSLLRGQTIDESSIKFKKTNVSRLNNGYFLKNSSLQQLQARRNLKLGTVLTPKNLAPRLLVHSGQQVTLVLNYNGLEIKSSGHALQSASRGQVIKVRNSQSQKIVEGVVSGEARVRVSL
jgi:flagella basal body P-ring formation protein FlgA